MNIWDEYNKWVQNPQGMTWWEYYNIFVSKRWHRESRQRNYKRNKDIIYKENSTKRDGREAKYQVIPVEDGDFYLEDSVLFLTYQDKGYSSDILVDRIRPFNFLTMFVDDEMNLTADIPNVIFDAKFMIDNNGNLTLNYG